MAENWTYMITPWIFLHFSTVLSHWIKLSLMLCNTNSVSVTGKKKSLKVQSVDLEISYKHNRSKWTLIPENVTADFRFKSILFNVITLHVSASDQDESISIHRQHWGPGRQRPCHWSFAHSAWSLAHPGDADELRSISWPRGCPLLSWPPLTFGLSALTTLNFCLPVSLYWKQVTYHSLPCDLIVWSFLSDTRTHLYGSWMLRGRTQTSGRVPIIYVRESVLTPYGRNPTIFMALFVCFLCFLSVSSRTPYLSHRCQTCSLFTFSL